MSIHLCVINYVLYVCCLSHIEKRGFPKVKQSDTGYSHQGSKHLIACAKKPHGNSLTYSGS